MRHVTRMYESYQVLPERSANVVATRWIWMNHDTHMNMDMNETCCQHVTYMSLISDAVHIHIPMYLLLLYIYPCTYYCYAYTYIHSPTCHPHVTNIQMDESRHTHRVLLERGVDVRATRWI